MRFTRDFTIKTSSYVFVSDSRNRDVSNENIYTSLKFRDHLSNFVVFRVMNKLCAELSIIFILYVT